ncbi:hypothetical protein V2J09_008784 [Rumex salicifolius]
MLQSINSLPLSSSLSLPPLLFNRTFPSFLRRNKSAAIRTTFCYLRTKSQPWIAQLAEEPAATTAAGPEDGPVEIYPEVPSIFATNDDPTFLQVSTSVLLTGAIGIFLFRSIRRRVKRAKELRFRSSGAKKTLKDEAMESLKAIGSISVQPKSEPSAIQALLGGITAGVIAVILYKFTTTIEASLNRQTLSDTYSVRQITITVRTIINGICYLATFVFGINSVGLILYSGQLALNSLFEGPNEKEKKQPSSPFSSEDQTNAQDNSENDQISDQ